jgi:cytochrome c-type biogenesis protein CcmH
MRRAPLRLAVALLTGLLLMAGSASVASAATPKVSFNDIEDELMCVTCNVPLNIAESAQASDERTEVHRLIALGLTKQQVKDRLVAEFGDQVLADPPRDGFNVTTWLVPIGAIGGVALLLVLALPRWRRRTAERAGTEADGGGAPALDADELRRLDDDLAATEI